MRELFFLILFKKVHKSSVILLLRNSFISYFAFNFCNFTVKK